LLSLSKSLSLSGSKEEGKSEQSNIQYPTRNIQRPRREGGALGTDNLSYDLDIGWGIAVEIAIGFRVQGSGALGTDNLSWRSHPWNAAVAFCSAPRRGAVSRVMRERSPASPKKHSRGAGERTAPAAEENRMKTCLAQGREGAEMFHSFISGARGAAAIAACPVARGGVLRAGWSGDIRLRERCRCEASFARYYF